MEWYIKLPLAILGLIELVIRTLVVLLLCCIIVGIMLFIDNDQGVELLTPWCFKHIQEAERKQSKGGAPSLSLSQRRKLEYLRQEQQLLDQRKKTLVDIQQLEGQIGSALQPLPH